MPQAGFDPPGEKWQLCLNIVIALTRKPPRLDWMDLNWQQNFGNKQNFVQIVDKSRIKVGKNILVNRLPIINNKIEMNW